jgi:pyruvyltransferase
MRVKILFLAILGFIQICIGQSALKQKGLKLFYWEEKFRNFGDYVSLKLVERIVQGPVEVAKKGVVLKEPKLLAIGSIMTFARNTDVIWGSGVNGNWLGLENYKFKTLDVRAVRGPKTRQFLKENFDIDVPEIYGDPALLIPYFFPEFKRKKNPRYEYIVIPHYSEQLLFSKEDDSHIVYPTDPWDEVIEKITDSAFVISSSLHGIVIAEAFGIPARLLRVVPRKIEAIYKYEDYYQGTGRPDFKIAYSVEEALCMGGEAPFTCDLQKLYEAFPFDYWDGLEKQSIDFGHKP